MLNCLIKLNTTSTFWALSFTLSLAAYVRFMQQAKSKLKRLIWIWQAFKNFICKNISFRFRFIGTPEWHITILRTEDNRNKQLFWLAVEQKKSNRTKNNYNMDVMYFLICARMIKRWMAQNKWNEMPVAGTMYQC